MGLSTGFGAGLATLLAAAALVLAASPALADSAPIPNAQYYRSTVDAVTPAVPGLTATVTPDGEWFGVSYSGDGQVVVLGYGNREQYVRLGPAGVQVNTTSLTSYLNDSLVISQWSQQSSDQPERWQTPPEWAAQPTGSVPAFHWHDHRVHWMSGSLPPKVAPDPEKPQPVSQWSVHLVFTPAANAQTGAQPAAVPVTVTGRVDWVGRPTLLSGPRGWLILGIAALAVVAFVVVLVRIARVRVTPPPLPAG